MGKDFSSRAVIGWKLDPKKTEKWLKNNMDIDHWLSKEWKSDEEWFQKYFTGKLPPKWILVYNEIEGAGDNDEFYLIFDLPEESTITYINTALQSSDKNSAKMLAFSLNGKVLTEPKMYSILMMSY